MMFVVSFRTCPYIDTSC